MSTRDNSVKCPVCGREGISNNLYADEFKPEEFRTELVCIFCQAKFNPCGGCHGQGIGDYPYECSICGGSGVGRRLITDQSEMVATKQSKMVATKQP